VLLNNAQRTNNPPAKKPIPVSKRAKTSPQEQAEVRQEEVNKIGTDTCFPQAK